MSELLQSANIDTCNCAECSDPAVYGGALAPVTFLLIVAIIVIVVLVLRQCRRKYLVKGRYVKLTHFTADNILFHCTEVSQSMLLELLVQYWNSPNSLKIYMSEY